MAALYVSFTSLRRDGRDMNCACTKVAAAGLTHKHIKSVGVTPGGFRS